MQPCRLILDSEHEGVWNLAVDEALLEDAAARGTTTLRIYAWSTPTVSLGYFQSLDDRHQHPASQACPIVRRSSGGGAIVHDRELTYSYVVPCAKWTARQALRLCLDFHVALAETLAEGGIPATLHQDPLQRGCAQPFLCFQRRSEGDIVVGSDKLAGSAQRRRGAALLQHGSLLLARSKSAPELPGLAELEGTRERNPESLISAWLPRLSHGLGLEFRSGVLTADESRRARFFCRDRFASTAWTSRR